MKKNFAGSMLLLTSFKCLSQQNNNTDLAKLRLLNARFIHNFVTNDTVSHSKIIHNEFVCITHDGRFISRQDYLNWWVNGFDGYKYWDYRNEDIKIFGNTALVHSQNKYVIIKEGKEITGMSMYTDIYIKENNDWKCVQAQLSNVSPENFGADETIVQKYDYRQKANNK